MSNITTSEKTSDDAPKNLIIEEELWKNCPQRIETEQEKATFEKAKKILIKRRNEIIEDYSPTVSLDYYKAEHYPMMSLHCDNEELQNLVEECKVVYKKGLEVKNGPLTEKKHLSDGLETLEDHSENNSRETSHKNMESTDQLDGNSISKQKHQSGQHVSVNEIRHILGVKQTEIFALNAYIENTEKICANLDRSKVKKEKILLDTDLKTTFEPINGGIEVCTILRTKSQAKEIGWDHGDRPIKYLAMDIDDDNSSISNYDNENQKQNSLLSLELEDMKSKYDLAKQQYSDLMTKHANVINELEKMQEGISLTNWKFKQELEKKDAKYEALERRIHFYAGNIEILGGSFEEHSIKAGEYETTIIDLESEIKTLNFEVQQYIEETEALNVEIQQLEADLEQQGKNYTQLLETNKKLWYEKAKSDTTINELEREKDFLSKQEDKMTVKLNEYEKKIEKYAVIIKNIQKGLDRSALLREQLIDQLKVSNDAISELLAKKNADEVMTKLLDHKNTENAELQSKVNEQQYQLEEQKDAIADLDRNAKSLQNTLESLDKMLLMLSDTVLIGMETNKQLLRECQERGYDLERAVDKLDKEQEARIKLEEQLVIVEDALEESKAEYLNSITVKAIDSNDQAISDLGLSNKMLLEQTQNLKKQIKIRGEIPEDKAGAVKHMNDLKHELSILAERMISTQIKISQINKQESMKDERSTLEEAEGVDGSSYSGSSIVQVDNVVLHTCIDNRHVSEEVDGQIHGAVGAVTTLVDIAGKSRAEGMASMILELDIPNCTMINMQ